MDTSKIEAHARAILHPLKPADSTTAAPPDMLFAAKRTRASGSLPPYYLVYFLLVDLLCYRNLGHFEKIAWSVPVDFDGRAFLIEHRKFGLGIFAQETELDEAVAQKIAERITRAVEVAEPYFDWLADRAANGSSLNVVNRSAELYDRHRFYVDRYNAKRVEAEDRKGEIVRRKIKHGYVQHYPAYDLRREAKWLALTAIDSFFSWTEHVFIHIPILHGKLTTGRDVRRAANSNWHEKYLLAMDCDSPVTLQFFDELKAVRRQIRNFDAHGSFGKRREAFSFHSRVGAVPLIMPHRTEQGSMRFGKGIDFVEHEAVELIERFIEHLWSGARSPARIYIQDSHLPLILSYAEDGTYEHAMDSDEDMSEFVDGLVAISDRHANMDF